MGGVLTNKLIYYKKQGKSLYMEDIYVQPQQRRKGVGLSLLRSVSQVCLPQQSSSMKK
jgi:predicted GNAT family acetyltransferase